MSLLWPMGLMVLRPTISGTMLNAVVAETVWRSVSFCAESVPNDANTMMQMNSAARLEIDVEGVKMANIYG